MKKISLLLAAIAIIGIGSAFKSPRQSEVVYVWNGTTALEYAVVQGQGQCVNDIQHCEEDASHNALDSNRIWQSNP